MGKRDVQPIQNILTRGDVGDGHRSRERATRLLGDFKKALGIGQSKDPQNDRIFEDFIAEVILGAAWYQKRYLSARRRVWLYIGLNCILVVGFPFALIALQRVLTLFKLNSVVGQVTSQVTSIATGVLGLQKTLAAWYSSQQRYATWYKSASDLKTIYYNLLANYGGKASDDDADFVLAVKSGIATARTIIDNERLDFYQKLTLPSFDVLDLLTSGSANVSGLVAKLLPSAPPSALSSIGKNSVITSSPSSLPQASPVQPIQPPSLAAPMMPTIVFSKHSLHHPLLESPQHKAIVAAQIRAISSRRALIRPMTAPAANVVEIPLTTVSLNTDFDANISILFTGSNPTTPVSLLVDSGNSVLIVPHWEDIAGLPNSSQNYTVLGDGSEPWGCPAKIVKGPIHLQTRSGGLFTIQNCVFYACSADNADGCRTANFGAACLSPWSSSAWNVPQGVGVTMQSPLAYASGYPFVEFDYEAPSGIFGTSSVPNVSTGSTLRLYSTLPSGYTMLQILSNMAWMALTPKSLTVGTTVTGWPGTLPSPIAMIDTGGGPVYLSDPNGYVWSQNWPGHARNPDWASTCVNCDSVSDPISIELGDSTNSLTYTIDPSQLPPAARGLTLVMCQDNYYMRGQTGMNIGGISALANFILIDFQSGRIGFCAKSSPSNATATV